MALRELSEVCVARMERNPLWCPPAIVDCESKSYTLTAAWRDEGFHSDVDAVYTSLQWIQHRDGVKVTMLRFTDKDIDADELKDARFLRYAKNKLFSFAYHADDDDPRHRQRITEHFHGTQFTVDALQDLGASSEIEKAIEALQAREGGLLLLAVLLQLWWDANARKLTLSCEGSESHI